MHRFLVALLLAGACGSASVEHEGDTVVGPPSVAWKDMTKPQRADFMTRVVMPKMRPLFQAFDAKGFHDFDCVTCHGERARHHVFEMPNPDIFVLPGDRAGFAVLFKEKPEWMHFMQKRVVPEMVKLLARPEFDSAHPDPNGFGCFQCHKHEEAGAHTP